MSRASGSPPGELDDATQSGEDVLNAEQVTPSLVPALTVLFHRDPRQIGKRAVLSDLATAREASLSRSEPLFYQPAQPDDRGEALADRRLSRQPVRFLPQPGGGLRLVAPLLRTPLRYRGVAVAGERVITPTELQEGGVLELGSAVALLVHQSPLLSTPDDEPFGLLGHSHLMQRVRSDIRRLAGLDAPVLVRGETGTGKELAARALHAESRRADSPFVAVNLGALPPSLAAAELFGALRGAYTGASGRQSGYFQQASGGTLFLDEVGEAPPEIQVLLMRAIEVGEFQPLGASAPQPLRARIIAATDADLEQLIRERAFRAPLLHRLAAYELRLPSLRARREDIVRLLLHFLRAEFSAQGLPFPLAESRCAHDRSDEQSEQPPFLPLRLLVTLSAYDWPGNVRQLRNVVRQIVSASHGQPALQLPAQLAEQLGAAPSGVPAAAPTAARRRRPADIIEEELLATLEANRWDLKATATALGIARPSLYMLLDRSPHIRAARVLPPDELQRAHAECGGDLDAMASRLCTSTSALRRRLRELGLR